MGLEAFTGLQFLRLKEIDLLSEKTLTPGAPLFTRQALIRLIIPLVIEQLLMMTVGMADTMMVTSAGEAAVSGVSLVDSLNLLLIQVFAALSTGGAVVVSQYLGRREQEQARVAAKQLLYTVAAVSAALMVLALLFRQHVLNLIFGRVEPAVMESALVYFLLTAAALTVKSKKPSDAAQLLWVLSIATIVWGAMTGTWFGLEGAMDVPLLRSLVVPTFANYPEYFNVTTTQQQNSVMKFCFILGTVQLSLACVMNIRRKTREKDLSWVADLGWLCAICALYFVVLYLVIGEQVNLTPIAAVVLLGFVLVVCFGGMSPDKTFAQGLKAGLGNAFTVFLNTISAFGNIMSYIRLFAVGMASLAIAQSFNNMALGFKGPLVVVGILIMLVGHGLNIVMGLLSVVVHGVRLNLLEFSGQLGMEWTGTAYAPFKKLDKIRK